MFGAILMSGSSRWTTNNQQQIKWVQFEAGGRETVYMLSPSFSYNPYYTARCKQPLHSPWFYYMVRPVFRQICALWLVLPRSGFCSTDRFHENSPSRVFPFEQSRQIQKFGPKQRKKKWILSFFSAKPPEKAKKIEILQRFQRCMKKTNTVSEWVLLSWRSGNVWYRNWNRLHRKPGGYRRFYKPTEKCKHKQEDGYWYEHSFPLHGSLYGIQRSIQRYLSYKKYSFKVARLDFLGLIPPKFEH